jgi:hypothetical protein
MPLREVYPDEVGEDAWWATLERLNGPPLTVTLASDGGPWAVHDMPCPVCLDRKAVVNLDSGGFGPCAVCQRAGWELRRRPRRFWRRIR